jgi:hypothetical protein
MENYKNCYYCLHIRPKKSNYCIIEKRKINDVNSYWCKYFLLDKYLLQQNEKKGDV